MPGTETAILPQLHHTRAQWPGWLPEEVKTYLRHVEDGSPLRELARASGCHPSTILRQVRRIESRRDDPLVDAALRGFGNGATHEVKSATGAEPRNAMGAGPEGASGCGIGKMETCSDDTLKTEGTRVLRRMCESGVVLAVVPDMEKAVVVRETPSGTTQRVAVVDTHVAQAMALKDWIACKTNGRILRYAITATGRTALGQMMAEMESQRSIQSQGMAEAPTAFLHQAGQGSNESKPGARRVRYGLAETPLSVLARRRDRQGQMFIGPDLVAAGERLREDFELAQMGPNVTQDWSKFLTGPANRNGMGGSGNASAEARMRLEEALRDLGPGLGDVALRCCCYLEGLEVAERQLGWAARSGKIVLRIALQRLKRFYEEQVGTKGGMIG